MEWSGRWAFWSQFQTDLSGVAPVKFLLGWLYFSDWKTTSIFYSYLCLRHTVDLKELLWCTKGHSDTGQGRPQTVHMRVLGDGWKQSVIREDNQRPFKTKQEVMRKKEEWQNPTIVWHLVHGIGDFGYCYKTQSKIKLSSFMLPINSLLSE